MAELDGNLFGIESSENSKFDEVTVEMLDYEYVELCNDKSKLKSILSVLKSGKEGFYPPLEKKVEDKLFSLLNDKERKHFERLSHAPTPMEISTAEQELDEWEKSVLNKDKNIRNGREWTSNVSFAKRNSAPSVRGTARVTLTSDEKSKPVQKCEQKTGRLSGYDFRAWEKFDVDKAVEEVDKEDIKNTDDWKQKNNEAATPSSSGKCMADLDQLRHSLRVDELSNAQCFFHAEREKQKGNECFKAKEYEQALSFYSRSLALDDTKAHVFTNRGHTYSRVDQFHKAEEDFNRAIQIDKTYVKAWYRRSELKFRIGKYAEAIDDIVEARKLDPTNPDFLSHQRKCEEKFRDVEGCNYVQDLYHSQNLQNSEKLCVSVPLQQFMSRAEWISAASSFESSSLKLLDDGFCVTQNCDESQPCSALTQNVPVFENTQLDGFTRIPIDESDDDSDNEIEDSELIEKV